VKAAKSSDWWVHIAGGGRGSHVLVTGVSSKSPLNPSLMRWAGILALHFSDRSKAREGDVYCTRRQFIRKTKGLPAGLWLVDKSETVLIRYDQEELADIFSKEIRDGIQRHRPKTP
jgi:predicted ribosome quality control (RQC) complex YloA/Tae2 family protein